MIKAEAKQKQIIAILTRGDKEFKAQLVVALTEDKNKSSTNDLSFAQANAIIKQLDGTPVVNRWTLFEKSKKSHLNILSLTMQLGWKWYHEKHARYYASMNVLGAWLQQHAPVKKSLIDMSKTEISKTITALESMQAKQLKKQHT